MTKLTLSIYVLLTRLNVVPLHDAAQSIQDISNQLCDAATRLQCALTAALKIYVKLFRGL